MGKKGVQEQAIERERRRLSVSKADEVKDKDLDPQEPTRGNITTNRKANILELFPAAKKKVSICGVAAEAQQKGFANKCAEQQDGTLCEGAEGLPQYGIGCACKKGLKPESPNQDDFCVFRIDSTGIYGVFDGHGPYGHDVSNFVQEALPRCFVKDADFQHDPEKALSTAFLESHRLCTDSQTEGKFDCTLSGTTATIVMQRDGTLYCAHVGDSRAVLARTRGTELKAEDLTVDHKPTLEAERKRIQAKGGQVRRLEGDIPHRVFVAGKLYPGLAMTRSIGDTVGSTAGVVAVPEVKSRKVEKDWRFVLLCTDGVWEFIDSQEAVNIISRYPPSEVQKAADTLASEAWNRWIQEEGNVVDDITVICIYFNED
jgi:serine/threonine protein phosphatase PrpC